MKTEIPTGTNIQDIKDTTEARVALEPIQDDPTGTEVPADKDNKVSKDETIQTTTEVDRTRDLITATAIEQIRHSDIETDQTKAAALQGTAIIDDLQKTQDLIDQSLFTSTKQSRKTG